MIVVGVDEVGRGPLAGPVVAAAVVLRQPIDGVTDSKLLSPKRRQELAAVIMKSANVAFGAASCAEIDRLNILQASLLAMRRAVLRLKIVPDEVRVDGNRAPDLPWPVLTMTGGDRVDQAIGAASIVAKVLRDRLMQRLDGRHPGYDWARNAGYGTANHRGALARLGITPHHRMSFKPVADAIAKKRIEESPDGASWACKIHH